MATTIVWAYGCDEDPERPPAPPPPPQLTLERYTSGSAAAFRLPDDDVYDIFVDSQNRLWMSTQSGIFMKDLNNPSVRDTFDDFDGIPNRQCRGITELNGTIFVGTWGGGVAYYDGTLPWVALPVGDGRVVSGRVFELAADDSSVWIGTVAGLTQYIHDLNRAEPQRYIARNAWLGGDDAQRRIQSVVVQNTSRGPEIWCGEGLGITVLRVGTVNDTVSVFYRSGNSGIPGNPVNEIAYDPGRDLFWSAYETVGFASVDVDAAAWTHLTTVSGLGSDLGSSVAVRWPKGDIWFGTQAGLTKRCNTGKMVVYPRGSGLPDERVRKVYIDAQQRVWVSFTGSGAARITDAGLHCN